MPVDPTPPLRQGSQKSPSVRERDEQAARIFFGAMEIAKLGATEDGVALWWPGELERKMWLPENIPSLIRVLLPTRTHGLSDGEVIDRADWGLTSERDLNLGLQARGTDFDSHRIDAAIGDLAGSITFRPANEIELDGSRVPLAAEISIAQSAERTWDWETMEFLKQHHSNRSVRGADSVMLAFEVTEVSRIMAERSREADAPILE
jgi:hypothetical protein